MKKIIIILITCIISMNLFAQQYRSFFGNTNTLTSIAQEAIDGFLNYDFSLDSTYIVNIEDKEYFDLGNGAYLRQSDEHDKLYYYQKSIYNKEFLIADMNLNIGDTFIINSPTENFIAKVIEIEIKNNLKTITTDFEFNFDTTTYKLSFIEGVGPNASFLFPLNYYDPVSTGNSILLCLQKDSTSTYKNLLANDNCKYSGYVAIKETKNKDTSIEYRQSTGEINICFSSKNSGQVNISSIEGKRVKSIEFKDKIKIKIRTDNLHAGYYILHINSKLNKASKKFLKI